MAKEVKIKEIESKVKIIREKGDDEIEDIVHDEPRMHDQSGGETMHFGGGLIKVSPILKHEEAGNQVRQDAVRAAQQGSARGGGERSGAQLYATGRGMGSEAAGQRANYRQARQTANASRMMQDSGGGYPVQQRGFVGEGVQGVGARNAMEQQGGGAVPERNYSEGGEKKKERRIGPWE
jgi:hypothetical protein